MMLTGRVLCVITGASRGYGRCLAQSLAKVAGEGSVLVLLARDSAGLSETRSAVESAAATKALRVECHSVDLSEADGTELSGLLSPLRGERFDVGVLVHNAGSVGEVDKPASSLKSRAALLQYYALNLVSPMLLTSAYLEQLRGSARRHVVVNISSLLALQVFPSLSMYSTGKAARDMFFRGVAVEEKEVRVLNWAPGPMDTAMVKEIIGTTFDSELKSQFQGMQFVEVEASVGHLINLLTEDKFESGAHIDVYDVMPATGKA